MSAKKACDAFYPGEFWLDTDRKRIEAHGGGMLVIGGTYFWYGENKSKNSADNLVGASCYSSRDLYNWKNEGVVLPKEHMPEKFRDTGVLERPKVIYNKKSGKYVMWMHLDGEQRSIAQAGVAVADSPTGPFTFVTSFRPIKYEFEYQMPDRWHQREFGGTFKDMTLFTDDDGSAYVLYSSEQNKTMYIVRLNEEYTGIQEPAVEGKTWSRNFIGLKREAPAPFKYKNKYYMFSSACTGWMPNPAGYATADSMLGPWSMTSDPCMGPESDTTFQSQSTFVIPAPGKKQGNFIYMGDRWVADRLVDSTYVWLPFFLNKEEPIVLENYKKWDLSIFDYDKRKLTTPSVKIRKNKGREQLTWNPVPGANAYRIYRNSVYEAVTTGTEYLIPTVLFGRSFSYTVTAIKINGEQSAVSKQLQYTSPPQNETWLDEIQPDHCTHGMYGRPVSNRSVLGGEINIAGKRFKRGISTHVYSRIVYNTGCNYKTFSAVIGLDHNRKMNKPVQFIVYGNNKILFQSKIMDLTSRPEKIRVPLAGIHEVCLVVTDAGEKIGTNHVSWADARFER